MPAVHPGYRSLRLCAAIVDRLTFGGNIIETGTTSYRLTHARTHRAPSRLTSGDHDCHADGTTS